MLFWQLGATGLNCVNEACFTEVRAAPFCRRRHFKTHTDLTYGPFTVTPVKMLCCFRWEWSHRPDRRLSLWPHAWPEPGSPELVPGSGQKRATGGAGRCTLQSSICREVHRQVNLLLHWRELYWLWEELHNDAKLLPFVPHYPLVCRGSISIVLSGILSSPHHSFSAWFCCPLSTDLSRIIKVKAPLTVVVGRRKMKRPFSVLSFMNAFLQDHLSGITSGISLLYILDIDF